MTYCHLAGHAETAGTVGNHFDRHSPQFAAIMQANVDSTPVAAGNGEDPVQLTFGVTVDVHRVESANHFRPIAYGLFQQLERAGTITPVCGKATQSMSIQSRCLSRIAWTPCRCARPVSLRSARPLA